MSISEDTIIITNIDRFTISFDNGNMILKRKKEKPEFKLDENYTKSKIVNCYIEGKKTDYTSYNQILKHIYNLFDSEFIIENSTINVISGKRTDKGYHYIQELNISYQGVSSNVAVKEIVSLTKLTGTSIKLDIELENKKVITYEN